jgi:hypothetical protein
MSKRIGPSMSTEPGWMAVAASDPFYLGMPSPAGRKLPQHAVEF